jgi:serine protease Do
MLKRLLAFALAIFISQNVYARDLPDFTELVAKEGPAVVNISTTQIIHNDQAFGMPPGMNPNDPFYDFFRRFAPQIPSEQEERSLGSGFIISSDGYILTNAHVVDGADTVTVRLTDKREFKAKVIGADRRADVALIKINATGLPQVTQGDPSKLKVGEWVVAIGSPFGFDNSVTAGIVSAKGRSLPEENYVPFIQTDAAINPGNSGGPLFNMNGEVVGINSQIYTRSGGYMGLSFAIPIDVAMNVANQLRTTGKVTRGRMGVTIQEVTRDLADSFGMSEPTGALVSNVEKGGPADKAGIQVSDVILKFDGKNVNSSFDLPRIVAGTHPGRKVTVELWRKGAKKDVTLVVGVLPEENNGSASNNGGAGGQQPTGESVTRMGLWLDALTDAQKHELDLNYGLVVVDAKGAAERAGLHRGDVLLAIGNVDLHSVRELNNVLKKIPNGRNVALLVRRGDNASYVAIKLDEK